MYDQILDNLPNGLFTTDKEGRINYCNAAAERIVGLSSSELIGSYSKDILLNSAAYKIACQDRETAQAENSGKTQEFIITRADGSTIPIICNSSALKDKQGNIIGGVEVFRDISSNKRLEESLRESERKLSTLFSNLPGIAYRCLNDKNWTMEFVSEGCLELTGYKASDLIGNKRLSYNDLIHPDDQRGVWDQIQKAVAENCSFKIVYRIETFSGEEKWVWEQGVGVFADNGDLLGLEGFISDITEPMRLEYELKASEKKYRRVFEGSKDMIFIVSKDGLIKDINQAGVDILKYDSKQELLSLGSVEAIYDNIMHWKVFKRQIDRHGFVKDFEAAFRKKDKTRIHCLLSGNAVRGQYGEIAGYEGIAKDVTARADASRNLQQRHRELLVLTSVALTMNTTQDLDKILMTALTKVLDALSLTVGGIFLIDHEESAFVLKAQQGLADNGSNANHQILLQDKLLMRSLLTKDLSLEPEPIFPPFKTVFRGINSNNPLELTCFLITAKEKASGFLALHVPSHRDLITGHDFHLLGSLGNFLGGAIENSRLLQTINKHREELKGLTARLFYSREMESRRIARELHDEAGQALTGINFTLDTIEKGLTPELLQLKEPISYIKKQIAGTYQEMRRISYRLHPALLSDLGLEPALDSYLTDISKHSDLEIDFKMIGFEKRVDPDIETALYRLSQEALTNTLKHANAKRFRLFIIKSYPRIILLAEDDGIGFDPDEFDEQKQALGLLSMRERSAMLGGNFSLRTSRGTGTRIRIGIPIKEASYE